MAPLPAPRPSLTIIAPLAFERSLLHRAGLGKHVPLLCCGPGSDAVRRCVNALPADVKTVVLAGVAGGLSPMATAGRAFFITAVRSADDDTLLHAPQTSAVDVKLPPCIVCSVDAPVTSAEAKRDLKRRSGADLVDLESYAFAHCCQQRGIRWAIIRGVSDGPDDALPPALLTCVDELGRPRRFRAAWLAISRPSLVPVMRRLQRDAEVAMTNAAPLIRSIATEEEPGA